MHFDLYKLLYLSNKHG